MTLRRSLGILSVALVWLAVTNSSAEDAKAKKPAKDSDRPLRSLVFLRNSHLRMDEASLIAGLKKAFPKDRVGTKETDDVHVVATGLASICTFKKEKLTLLINSFPRPYIPDREEMAKQVARITRDKEQGKAMLEHKAWFSVDILGGEVGAKNEESHYELLSKVIAPFHDKDTTLLFFPEKEKLYPANDAALKLLQDGKALDLTRDGIVNVDGDDVELKAAVTKARKQWTDFVAAFRARKGENHAVKFAFQDKERGPEFMWIKVDRIDGETVTGILANVPNIVTHVKEGDVVKRSSKEIQDWLYLDDEKIVGGFSIEVLQRRQKERASPKKR